MAASKATSVVFYYDIVCPFAYMASRLVEGVCQRAGATVQWRPVLLGGLYELTHAAQGKGGSATDVMNPAKLRISGQDLFRQMKRTGAPYTEPNVHPQKTVTAMRLLAAIPDNSLRASVSHSLYRAYWCEKRDVTDLNVLEEVAAPHGVNSSQLLESEVASRVLRANTAEAAERGAFGVPGFYVGGKYYFGTDRLFFVDRALRTGAEPDRLASPPSQGGTAKLTFYFDYSSPWAFLGYMRLEKMLASVAPMKVKMEFVPILLGALFKQLGTPNVPLAAMTEAKRNYYQKDMQDWIDFAGVKFQWPDSFPIRSVLPLRVTLAAGCDPKVIDVIYKAVWQQNRDIANEEVLLQVLEEGSIEGARTLLKEAQSPSVKSQLHSNTSRAYDTQLCGVPTFQVNDGIIFWGQDKMNMVADAICGWEDPVKANELAKL